MPAGSIAQVIPFTAPPRAEALRRVAEALRSSVAALETAAEALLVIADEPEPRADGRDDMLTVAEAARDMRRSPAFVRDLCRRRILRSLRDGHGYRIRRSALAAYEKRRSE